MPQSVIIKSGLFGSSSNLDLNLEIWTSIILVSPYLLGVYPQIFFRIKSRDKVCPALATNNSKILSSISVSLIILLLLDTFFF